MIIKPGTQASTILGWKNYTNTRYNYSIQYPNTWNEATSKPEFINVPGELSIIPPSEETPVGVQVQVAFVVSATQTGRYSFYTSSDFNIWLNKPNDTSTNKQIYKIGNTYIGGEDAVQLIQQTLPNEATEPYYSIITWFRKENSNYYIELGGISPSKVQTYRSDYDKILSTFKFGN